LTWGLTTAAALFYRLHVALEARGLSLNVADPRGLDIAKKLLARCDVLAEGFSPACSSGGASATRSRRRSVPVSPPAQPADAQRGHQRRTLALESVSAPNFW
jgi:hypothetical protein